MKYSFKNDYSEIGHPIVLKELLDDAYIQNNGYGFDENTKMLEKLISEKAFQEVKVVLASGGTQTNLTVISKALARYEAVISVDSGHINVHETGAVEGTGHKVLTVLSVNGKITSQEIERIVNLHQDCHMVLPKMVYFSNATEVGTSYTKQELGNIYKTCKKLGLYVFIDGARLSQAMVAEGVTLKDMVECSDVFYLGGTKNGLPYGELIVIKNKDIYHNFHYHLKNRGAMLAKTFVVSKMFYTLLSNDLYLELAENANMMAKKLRDGLDKLGFEICYPNKTNQLFVKMDKGLVNKLSSLYAFEVWEDFEDSQIIRLVTSWATKEERIVEFLEDLKEIR
ncbi:MAG: threonine aldolase [Bacilli bacterium]|nr:threonine aldolase [Bacilli bacterium]